MKRPPKKMNDGAAGASAPPASAPPAIRYSYHDGPHCRTIRAQGALLSLARGSCISLALYNERPTLPRMLQQTVGEQGVAERIEAHEDGHFVREVEAHVLLDLRTMRAIAAWVNSLENKTPG